MHIDTERNQKQKLKWAKHHFDLNCTVLVIWNKRVIFVFLSWSLVVHMASFWLEKFDIDYVDVIWILCR